MPPNATPRAFPQDGRNFQDLSTDSSDDDDAGAPIKFKSVTRKRCHADVVTPQKAVQSNSGSSSATSSKPALTRMRIAPITPAATMPHCQHSGTPAGRKGGVLKAFKSLSISESASSATTKLANKKPIVLSDTETESADSDEDSNTVGVTPYQQLPTPEPSLALSDFNRANSVRRFAERSKEDKLERSIIAHCPETQRLMDFQQIAWGTQYELARGVCGGAWRWEDVRSRLDRLKGNNVSSAFKVLHIMRDQDVDDSLTVNPLWMQLDLEQDAILENKLRGLGLMDPEAEWQGHTRWYGGQIQQVGRLVKKKGLFCISLEPMEMRRSHRFARFYGSRRIIQIKIPDIFMKDSNYDKVDESACEAIKKFFAQKFILCGRCFIPFHAKEGSVYLLETNDNFERTTQPWCGDQYRLSLQEFLRWHNPLEQKQNYEQYISKWVTRFALGLSNSVPAVEFEEKNIFFIDDIVAAGWPSDKKAPAEKLMTDGCGFINRVALAAIAKNLSHDGSEVVIPSGVQGRIAGSKGFWILHPNDSSDDPKIWIRDSQKKIHYPSLDDRSHRIFDLLATTTLSSEMALTTQSVLNLFANGLPEQTLVTMMEESLSDTIKPLLAWKDEVMLTNAISRSGNVAGTRAQRAAASRSRALGLSGREWDNEKHEETSGDYIDVSLTTYTGRNQYSGAALALHESALELVQTGFRPDTCRFLYDKMNYIIQNTIDSAAKDCRIPSKHSFGAYVVPDPFGILEEDEIYFQFSRIRNHPVTALPFTVLEGDVVVGRYPIRLPSDMRKVKAVNKTRLSPYRDVIVISTKGYRSLASLLAGGDMDGDEWVVFYDPIIVKPFQNKLFTEEPPDLNQNFHAEAVEKVPDFCRRIPTQQEFLQKLLSNVEKAQVGIYSKFHEVAIVRYGYHDQETIRMAYIFAGLLDSSKNGKRINPITFQADRKKYFGSSSESMERRSPHRDILQILKQAARQKGDELLKLYTSANQPSYKKADPDLKRPYESALAPVFENQPIYPGHVTFLNKELGLIRAHVDAAYKIWEHSLSGSYKNAANGQKTQNKKSARIKSDQSDLVLEAARLYSQPIPGIVLVRDLDEVKASYAYGSCSQKFGFNVAFGILCWMKGKSCPGGLVASIRSIDEARSVSASYLKAITR